MYVGGTSSCESYCVTTPHLELLGDSLWLLGDVTAVFPLQCVSDTPTLLGYFDVASVATGVTVRWNVQVSDQSMEFRLEGNHDSQNWEVPVTEEEAGRFVAEDHSTVLIGGGVFDYRLFARTGDESWLLVREQSITIDPPQATESVIAYPNPFNPETTIAFNVPHPGMVRITVHDLAGRHVATLADGAYSTGWQSTTWSGCDDSGRAVASGSYLLRVKSNSSITRRMLTLVR